MSVTLYIQAGSDWRKRQESASRSVCKQTEISGNGGAGIRLSLQAIGDWGERQELVLCPICKRAVIAWTGVTLCLQAGVTAGTAVTPACKQAVIAETGNVLPCLQAGNDHRICSAVDVRIAGRNFE